jgi:hypothetical protein
VLQKAANVSEEPAASTMWVGKSTLLGQQVLPKLFFFFFAGLRVVTFQKTAISVYF